jgi:dipeptidyl aminopeptidase/acylaminoacyl peptidase
MWNVLFVLRVYSKKRAKDEKMLRNCLSRSAILWVFGVLAAGGMVGIGTTTTSDELVFIGDLSHQPSVYLLDLQRQIRIPVMEYTGLNPDEWSPDGQWLLMRDGATDSTPTFSVIDMRGNMVWTQTSRFVPSWSSDNRLMIVQDDTTGSNLKLFDPHTGMEEIIVSPPNTFISQARWSHDGERIAYFCRTSQEQLYIFTPATQSIRQITSFSEPTPIYNNQLVWRYDDQALLYRQYQRDADKTFVFQFPITDPDSSLTRYYAENYDIESFPVFSPDQRYAVFWTSDYSYIITLRLMDLTTGVVQTLASPTASSLEVITWSNDSRMIVFGFNLNHYWVEIGQPDVVHQLCSDCGSPQFRP